MDKKVKMRLREDFLRFIKSQSILGVAIGILIGQVFAKFINSIIEGLVMPILELFFHGTQWQRITINIGKVRLNIGIVIASMLDFLIVSIVVFLLIKFIQKIRTDGLPIFLTIDAGAYPFLICEKKNEVAVLKWIKKIEGIKKIIINYPSEGAKLIDNHLF